ncbi:hypothetical protein DK389_03975 [Methylobacterium durans]|uniref:Helix-turn-helix domain-containing protein n=1 Tax=Methylobacterium durans TaxID=2202825 RepID=A0A2U8WDT6_9HYPH|nr:hypothetical protein DK389_03975 [Methylobacterium durans]
MTGPIPDRLARAFTGRTTLNLREAAAALEMDKRHLRSAVRAGRVGYLIHGQGERRARRRFLLCDLVQFLQSERRRECPSTRAKVRRSSGATSGSKDSAFGALRARLTGAPPKPSSGA